MDFTSPISPERLANIKKAKRMMTVAVCTVCAVILSVLAGLLYVVAHFIIKFW